MDIECTWCEKSYSVNPLKAQKKIAKKGYMKTRCPVCKSMNTITDKEVGISSERSKNADTGEGLSNLLWINSIQFQTTAIVLLLVTLILGSFFLYNYRSIKDRMENRLIESSNNTAQQLSKYLSIPLWGVETEAIADALASEMLDRDIYAIHIIDQDRKGVLVGKKRDPHWQITSSEEKIEGDFITAENDIVYKKELIGKVQLFTTPKFMQADLVHLSRNLVIATLSLYIAIIVGVFFTLQRIIVHPIRALTDAADSMSRGELDTQINIRSKNELGTLVDALKRMQMSLVLSLNRLKQRSL